MLIKPKSKKFWMPSLTLGGLAGGASSAYAYLGNDSNTGIAGLVNTGSITMNGSAGVLVVFVGLQVNTTFTSIIYDPGGANITLTAATSLPSSWSTGIFYGTVPGFSGSKTIQVTTANTIQFFAYSIHAWIATGLALSSSRTVNSVSSTTMSMNVTAGYLMFAGSFNPGPGNTPVYTSSTQAAAAVHADTNSFGWSADWTIAATNASFSVFPKSGTSYAQSAATFF
jgi:hypothetical protein